MPKFEKGDRVVTRCRIIANALNERDYRCIDELTAGTVSDTGRHGLIVVLFSVGGNTYEFAGMDDSFDNLNRRLTSRRKNG